MIEVNYLELTVGDLVHGVLLRLTVLLLLCSVTFAGASILAHDPAETSFYVVWRGSGVTGQLGEVQEDVVWIEVSVNDAQ